MDALDVTGLGGRVQPHDYHGVIGIAIPKDTLNTRRDRGDAQIDKVKNTDRLRWGKMNPDCAAHSTGWFRD